MNPKINFDPTGRWARIGTMIASKFFARRGGHAEVHLSEVELAALLTFAVECGAKIKPDPEPELLEALKLAASYLEAEGKPAARHLSAVRAALTRAEEA